MSSQARKIKRQGRVTQLVHTYEEAFKIGNEKYAQLENMVKEQDGLIMRLQQENKALKDFAETHGWEPTGGLPVQEIKPTEIPTE